MGYVRMALELGASSLRELRGTLGLSQESLARVLGVSARTVERWEAGARTENPGILRRLDALTNVATLGREVYGDELDRFMSTPRQSLGQRTPIETLVRGDVDLVLGVLAQALEGQWA